MSKVNEFISNKSKFKVTGRLVTEKYETDGNVLLTLIINNEYKNVYPMITCDPIMVPEHKEHSYFDIEGHLGTRRKGGKSIPALVADKVNLSQTMLEKQFGVPGRFVLPEKIALCYVIGTIENIKDDGEYVRYMVSIDENGAEQYVRVKLDWKKIDRHPCLDKGDKICAVCKITTPKKIVGTEERIFMNFMVLDMNKIES